MKNANKLIILLILVTISCNRNKANDDENIRFINPNNSYINPNSDSIFYKLDIYTKNDKYFRDSQDNLTFLITSKITAFGKDFWGRNTGWAEAIKYYRTNKHKSEINDLYMVTTIAIKNNKGNFDNIWMFNNHISEHKENDGNYTYGYIGFNVLLDKSYNDKRLNIIFKTTDFDDGYRQYTLTYENNGEFWKLISRESIKTVIVNKFDDRGYCIDTINRFISEKLYESDKFSFGLEYITEIEGFCY